MIYRAFNGLVEFDMTYRTVKSDIIWGRFTRAVPEWVSMPPQEQNIFFLCAYGVGMTKAIHFTTDDLPDELIALRDYWAFAQSAADYRAVWEMFISTLSSEAYSEWLIAYDHAQARDPRLLAPPELQPGSPEEVPDEVKKKKTRPRPLRPAMPQASGI